MVKYTVASSGKDNGLKTGIWGQFCTRKVSAAWGKVEMIILIKTEVYAEIIRVRARGSVGLGSCIWKLDISGQFLVHFLSFWSQNVREIMQNFVVTIKNL